MGATTGDRVVMIGGNEATKDLNYFLNVLEKAPAAAIAADSSGKPGQVWFDATHVYICTATDTWIRLAIVAW